MRKQAAVQQTTLANVTATVRTQTGIDSVLVSGAGKMKAASLKCKPERREWEQAPDFFKWTCGEYEHVVQARQLPRVEDRLSQAADFRQTGNMLFASDDLDAALLQCAPHTYAMRNAEVRYKRISARACSPVRRRNAKCADGHNVFVLARTCQQH